MTMLKTIRKSIGDVPAHWVGNGFLVRSLFTYQDGNEFDPFLLLDYAAPHQFAPGKAERGVGEHPHRGFETVTIVYQGELEHRDSSGGRGTIGPGDVQWMTAASGVVHEEFHGERFTREGGVLEMIQLWVNLPAKDKISTPRYQAILDAHIPKVVLPEEAGILRVIAGDIFETRGPAKTFSPINVWDAKLNAGKKVTLPIPTDHHSLLIVQSGNIQIGGQPAKGVELLVLGEEGDAVGIEAQDDSRIFILSGKPLREPVFGQGPFVMNTREEIHQAIADYQSGRMGH